jgi:hypothetical protein
MSRNARNRLYKSTAAKNDTLHLKCTQYDTVDEYGIAGTSDQGLILATRDDVYVCLFTGRSILNLGIPNRNFCGNKHRSTVGG